MVAAKPSPEIIMAEQKKKIADQIAKLLPPRRKVEIDNDKPVLTHREYLEQIGIPVAIRGLEKLARTRPANPIDALPRYLWRNQDTCDNPPTGNTYRV